MIGEQADQIAELRHRLGQDSSTSSRPPSSDAPRGKKPAKTRSSRKRSGRKPGKQPGSASASRSLAENPDETFEYQLVSRRCGGCGHLNDPIASDGPAR